MKPHPRTHLSRIAFLAFILPALANTFADAPASTPGEQPNPNQVRVERMDFGNGPVVHISTPQLRESLYYDKQGGALMGRTLELTIDDTDEQLVRQSININDEVIKSTTIERFNKKTREQNISTYSTKGRHLYTFRSAPGQPDAYLDAEGNPISRQQADQLALASQEDAIDLARLLKQTSPPNPQPSALQDPNEVRVWRHSSQFSRGLLISTRGLTENLTYDDDGKVLVGKNLFAVLRNNETEIVLQSIVITGNTVSFVETKRINHQTGETEITTNTPAGRLLVSEHRSPGQPTIITDGEGNPVSQDRAREIVNSPNPDQIDIDKVPVQDMTNLGKAPAAASTPPTE